jgi:hypothetical protein
VLGILTDGHLLRFMLPQRFCAPRARARSTRICRIERAAMPTKCRRSVHTGLENLKHRSGRWARASPMEQPMMISRRSDFQTRTFALLVACLLAAGLGACAGSHGNGTDSLGTDDARALDGTVADVAPASSSS